MSIQQLPNSSILNNNNSIYFTNKKKYQKYQNPNFYIKYKIYHNHTNKNTNIHLLTIHIYIIHIKIFKTIQKTQIIF